MRRSCSCLKIDSCLRRINESRFFSKFCVFVWRIHFSNMLSALRIKLRRWLSVTSTLQVLPTFMTSVCSVNGHAMLRSVNHGELTEPCTKVKSYGPRSFRVPAATGWNNLPKHLRTDDISCGQFVRKLNAFLFVRAYSSRAPLRTFV